MELEKITLNERVFSSTLEGLHEFKKENLISSRIFIKKRNLDKINLLLVAYFNNRCEQTNKFITIMQLNNMYDWVDDDALTAEYNIYEAVIEKIYENADLTPYKIFKNTDREKIKKECAFKKLYYFCYHQISKK